MDVHVAEDMILAGYKAVTGEWVSYEPESKIGQIYQEKGALSGSLYLFGSLVTAPMQPIKDFFKGDYYNLGQSVGSAGVGYGALKLKHGYDNVRDSLGSLPSSFNSTSN